MSVVTIVGGAGYVGQCLSRELVVAGVSEIRIFDVAMPEKADALFPSQARHIKGDVRSEEDLRTAFRGSSAVFHLAAVGMTGKSSLNRPFVESINVGGTAAVVAACAAESVPALLFASTVNAVFRDQPVHMATEEECAYVSPEDALDNYSRTKGVAEQLVIKANGLELANGGRLRTTALRFPGVYGIGEVKHQPRIISYAKSGLFVFTYAKGGHAEAQWVNGPNAAQAFRKALAALQPDRGAVAAGSVYFINDGPPIDSFECMKPLVEVYAKYPTVKVPFEFMLLMAYLMEFVFGMLPFLEKLVGFDIEPPGVTRVEVVQVGISHTYSIEKARRELGYDPQNPNDFERVAEHYRKEKMLEDEAEKASGSFYPNSFVGNWKKAALAMFWFSVVFFPIFFTVLQNTE